MAEQAVLLFIALVIDRIIGDPKWLWQYVSHPVALFGRLIAFGDEQLNLHDANKYVAMRKGAGLIVCLILLALLIALAFEQFIALQPVIGWIVEVAIVWVFLAQKSLFDHVGDVARGLQIDGLEGGREAVGRIVGRDPQTLDESGVVRAAIESLAENFSDGVVAPAFWYLVFGLPGLLVYKMINTADSMIAYKNEKYLHFGNVTAQIDDLANWLPARLSAGFIAMAAMMKFGWQRARYSLQVVARDGAIHASPNAGWPEAAMAGAGDFALGGPRKYSDKTVSQAYINATGKMALGSADIELALELFARACYVLWAGVFVWWLFT